MAFRKYGTGKGKHSGYLPLQRGELIRRLPVFLYSNLKACFFVGLRLWNNFFYLTIMKCVWYM